MSLVGSLEDLGLGEILQIVSLSRRSGILYLAHQAKKGMIIFKMGQVISASSNEKKDNFVTNLIKMDYMNPDNVKSSYAFWKAENMRIPYSQYLLQKFNVPPDVMNELHSNLIEKTIYGFFGWPEGTFNFELKENESELEAILNSPLLSILEQGLSPQFLAMEGSRLYDEMKRSQPVVVKPKDEKHIKPAEALREDIKILPDEISLNYYAPDKAKDLKEKAQEVGTFNLNSVLNDISASLEQGESLFPDIEPVTRTAHSPVLELLKSMMGELMNPDTVPEVSLLVLRFASELMNRAILLLVKKDEICGLGGFGIRLKDNNPDKVVREIKIPLNEPSIFSESIAKKFSLKKKLEPLPWHEYFLKKLGGGTPAEVYVAPIFTVGKITALLYGDNLPENTAIGDTDSLDIFLNQAGLAMEKAFLRRKLQKMKIKNDSD